MILLLRILYLLKEIILFVSIYYVLVVIFRYRIGINKGLN